MPCTVQMAVILSSLLSTTGQRDLTPGEGRSAAGTIDGLRVDSPRLWLGKLLAFLGGYLVTFLAAASVAALVVQASGWIVGISVLQVAGGLVLAGFGLQVIGLLRLPGAGPCGGPVGFFLGRPYRSTPRPSRMGMTFAVYCAGCCGPAALGSALLLTGSGSAAGAALLLLVYAAGMAIPFVLLAVGFVFALRTLRVALRFAPLVTMTGGGVAVVMGAALALRPLFLLLGG